MWGGKMEIGRVEPPKKAGVLLSLGLVAGVGHSLEASWVTGRQGIARTGWLCLLSICHGPSRTVSKTPLTSGDEPRVRWRERREKRPPQTLALPPFDYFVKANFRDMFFILSSERRTSGIPPYSSPSCNSCPRYARPSIPRCIDRVNLET